MKLDDAQIVGALTLLHGKAPFDRANIVVASRHDPEKLLQVTTYLEEGALDGKILSMDDLRGLVRAEQAILLDPALPVRLGSALWLLRETFDEREAALEELKTSGVLLLDYVRVNDGSWGCLVREPEANKLRDGWASRASGRAFTLARRGNWQGALRAASRAFVLERAMTSDSIAMLALCHDRCGNTVRAKGYVDMARSSRGDAFADAVRKRYEELVSELVESPPESGPRPRFRDAMERESAKLIKSSLSRIKNRAAA